MSQPNCSAGTHKACEISINDGSKSSTVTDYQPKIQEADDSTDVFYLRCMLHGGKLIAKISENFYALCWLDDCQFCRRHVIRKDVGGA